MIPFIAVLTILFFLAAFHLAKINKDGKEILHLVQNAISIIRDESIDEYKREKQIQKTSIKLFAKFASIAIKSILAVIGSLVPIWLSDLTGLTSTKDVLDYLATWQVILSATIIISVLMLIKRSARNTAFPLSLPK